jgi:exodeoxyribonuclease VII large subunit
MKGRLQALTPQGMLKLQRQRLLSVTDWLERGSFAILQMKRESLQRAVGKLGALSPLAVLERGFALCMRLPSLKIVRDAEEVGIGEDVLVRLFQGKILCHVKEREI